MKAKTSNHQALLPTVRDHLLDVIERLMNNSDPDADPKDGIKPDDAKLIIQATTQIVNSAKVEHEFLRTVANAQNPQMLASIFSKSTVIENAEKLLPPAEPK